MSNLTCLLCQSPISQKRLENCKESSTINTLNNLFNLAEDNFGEYKVAINKKHDYSCSDCFVYLREGQYLLEDLSRIQVKLEDLKDNIKESIVVKEGTNIKKNIYLQAILNYVNINTIGKLEIADTSAELEEEESSFEHETYEIGNEDDESETLSHSSFDDVYSDNKRKSNPKKKNAGHSKLLSQSGQSVSKNGGRGRGRPRKSEMKESKPSRGRGRPKKAKPEDFENKNNSKSSDSMIDSQKVERVVVVKERKVKESAKKSRGRPKKLKISENFEFDDENVEIVSTFSDGPKPKKMKNSVEEQGMEPSSESSRKIVNKPRGRKPKPKVPKTPGEIARKRGRPRKTFLAVDLETSLDNVQENEEEEEVPTSKPKLYEEEEKTEHNGNDNDQEDEMENSEPSSESSEEIVTKPRRGRKPKPKVPKNPGEIPRKRGRPRKTFLAVDLESRQVNVQENEEEEEVPTSKSKLYEEEEKTEHNGNDNDQEDEMENSDEEISPNKWSPAKVDKENAPNVSIVEQFTSGSDYSGSELLSVE